MSLFFRVLILTVEISSCAQTLPLAIIMRLKCFSNRVLSFPRSQGLVTSLEPELVLQIWYENTDFWDPT